MRWWFRIQNVIKAKSRCGAGKWVSLGLWYLDCTASITFVRRESDYAGACCVSGELEGRRRRTQPGRVSEWTVPCSSSSWSESWKPGYWQVVSRATCLTPRLHTQIALVPACQCSAVVINELSEHANVCSTYVTYASTALHVLLLGLRNCDLQSDQSS